MTVLEYFSFRLIESVMLPQKKKLRLWCSVILLLVPESWSPQATQNKYIKFLSHSTTEDKMQYSIFGSLSQFCCYFLNPGS